VITLLAAALIAMSNLNQGGRIDAEHRRLLLGESAESINVIKALLAIFLVTHDPEQVILKRDT
jgi:hypothetical protein